MGTVDGFDAMRGRLEASGRSDLVPRLARSFAPLAAAEKRLRFVDAPTGELLPVCVDEGTSREIVDAASATLAALHRDKGARAGRALPATQLAQLVHSLATRQTPDRTVAAWLLKMFCELNAGSSARAIIEGQTGDDPYYGVTLGRWFEHGCCVVRVDAKLAASLIFTEVGEQIDSLPPPWPAFRIEVPAGLIPSPRKRDDAFVASIDLAHSLSTDGAIWWDWTLQDSTKPHAQLFSSSTEHGFESTPLQDDFEALIAKDGWQQPDALADRLSVIVVRLVRGLLATMQDPAAVRRTRSAGSGNKWRMSKAPATSDFVVGRDIEVKIDCTAAVSSFVRGERRDMPTIQWPVRGHWRRQACGPGLVDRRPTWIQPHWKGPEHASRLVRRQILADAQAAHGGQDAAPNRPARR